MSGLDSQYAMGFGQGVPASVLAYAPGFMSEHLGRVQGIGNYRTQMEQTQPVRAMYQFHKLPPVQMRIPIADQYAMGIRNPNLSPSDPDPSIWQSVNGTTSLGMSAEERAARIGQMRSQIQQQARMKNEPRGSLL